LNEALFHQAEILKTKIPELLLQSQQVKFAKPDEYDQCGIYLQIKVDDELKTFFIDTDMKAIPSEIHEYAQLILKLSRLR
jgi:hypothetical protein